MLGNYLAVRVPFKAVSTLDVWLTSCPSVGASHLAVCTNVAGSAIGLVLVGGIPSLLRPLPRLQTFCCFCTAETSFRLGYYGVSLHAGLRF